MEEINKKIATGVGWMVLLRMIDRGLGLISMIILARLLTPGDFGVVAMATAFVAGLELFTNFSFDTMLIQKRNATRANFDTAWTFMVIFGVTMASASPAVMTSPSAVATAIPNCAGSTPASSGI